MHAINTPKCKENNHIFIKSKFVRNDSIFLRFFSALESIDQIRQLSTKNEESIHLKIKQFIKDFTPKNTISGGQKLVLLFKLFTQVFASERKMGGLIKKKQNLKLFIDAVKKFVEFSFTEENNMEFAYILK